MRRNPASGKINRFRVKGPQVIPYIWSLLMTVGLTVLLAPLQEPLGLVNIAMIYLLPVLFSSAKWGKSPAFAAATSGMLAFDFFFVHPVGTLTVQDARYLITFAMFLLVGIITGSLSAKLKTEAANSRQRATRVAALYSLSRDIAAVTNLDSVLRSVIRNVANTVEGEVIVLLPGDTGKLETGACSNSDNTLDETEMEAAYITYKQGKQPGPDVLKKQNWLFFPLQTEQGIQGVLGFQAGNRNQILSIEQIQLLEAYAGLTAMAINRVNLTEQARQAQTLIESEQLRTSLFNSLSHDLRTPLASILGAVTSLLEGDAIYTTEARQDLLLTIKQGAARMHRFINNLLDMARLESGMLILKNEWCDIQDIIGVAVHQLEESLQNRPLQIRLEPDLPLVRGDFVLLQQVLINLLDNALKYSDLQTEIVISADKTDHDVQISVSDQGQKIPEKDLPRIFDKFYRIKSSQKVRGTGLGLSICKGLIEAHGGRIWAKNTSEAGAVISFVLPLSKDYPNTLPGREEGDMYGDSRIQNPNC